jgi:hypothetical protein
LELRKHEEHFFNIQSKKKNQEVINKKFLSILS